MTAGSSCDYGYHAWRDHGAYWECDVCRLVERKQRPEVTRDRG